MAFIIEQRDNDLHDTSASIRYYLDFSDCASHILNVKMEIDVAAASDLDLFLPVWMPGSYKVREMSAHLNDVVVTDQTGESLSWSWTAKNAVVIRPKETSTVVVTYTYYAADRGVRTSHISRQHAFLVPAACLLGVKHRTDEIHHVYLCHDRTVWNNVSTPLSQVNTDNNSQSDSLLFGALSYDILADSPIEIGNHQCTSFDLGGAKHEIAVISQTPRDIRWLAENIRQIVETQLVFWGELPYDRYVFILLVAEGQRGGLEHLRCNVSAVEPSAFSNREHAQQMFALLTHEFFHTWNIKRIRPIEYGPFDYSRENYSSMLWLVEGVTSYYDDLLAYRGGFYSQDEYLYGVVLDNIRKLHRVQGRFSMSVKDSSYLAWVKLYTLSPDMNNRFPSYYLKGGLIAMLIDLHIISETKGSRSLQDAMRGLWQRYKNNPEVGVTEEEVFEIIHRETTVDVAQKAKTWLESTDELPYNTYLRAVGLYLAEENKTQAERTPLGSGISTVQLPLQVFIGFSIKDENGKIIVKEVEINSPAHIAGFGVDDEILAINGFRTYSSSRALELLIENGIETSAIVTAVNDGVVYETKLLPIRKVELQLRSDNKAPQDALSLLYRWLKREK